MDVTQLERGRERGRAREREGGIEVTSVSTQENASLSTTTHTHFSFTLVLPAYFTLHSEHKIQVCQPSRKRLTSSQCKIKPVSPYIAHECVQVAHPPNQLYCPAFIIYALWPCKKCTLRQHEGENRGDRRRKKKRKRTGEGGIHRGHSFTSPRVQSESKRRSPFS